MGFEKFKNRFASSTPFASISANGQIRFGSAAVREFGISKYRHLELYFDREKDRIGIKLLKEPRVGSYSIKCYRNGFVVSAKSFFGYFKIDIEKSFSLEATRDEAEDMIILDLRDPENSPARRESTEHTVVDMPEESGEQQEDQRKDVD